MNHFDTSLSNLGNSQSDDLVRQAIVVLMGSLAKHMDKNDPKVLHALCDNHAPLNFIILFHR